MAVLKEGEMGRIWGKYGERIQILFKNSIYVAPILTCIISPWNFSKVHLLLFVFQPNAAGQRWMDVVKGQWTTYLQLNPTSTDQTFSQRAFQAQYSVNVKYNGNIICQRIAEFDVPIGQDAEWTINVADC